MRLRSEFIRLPLSFDVERLRDEALQFSEHEWDYHPQRYDGNTALNLVSRDGQRSDSYVGAMRATTAMERCPYINQVMASFNTVIGRSRFMRLAPGKGVPPHSDTDYSWRNRVRIHIPIITDPNIVFSSTGNIDVHMRAGEAWIFDNWREHAVFNTSDIERIHLVVDTVGSAAFWEMASKGQDPKEPESGWTSGLRSIPFKMGHDVDLEVEQYNLVSVRSADEIQNMLNEILSELDYLQQESTQTWTDLNHQCTRLVQQWRSLWALYADTKTGIPYYRSLIKELKTYLNLHLGTITLKSNGVRAYDVLANWLDYALDASLAISATDNSTEEATRPAQVSSYAGKVPEFERPIFVVAAPRSGSTMLYEALKNNKELWSIGDEAHAEIESIAALHPRSRGFKSNALSAADATESHTEQILDAFMYRLQNARSAPYSEMPTEFQPNSIRFLEKTPKNALRIPFLKAMFTDAKFIFLYRQARSNIGSIIDAWVSQKFITYPDLPDWQGPPWSLLLPPGWQEMNGQSVAHLAAFQWAASNQVIMRDLSAIQADDYLCISYESLLRDPGGNLRAACEFAGLPFGPRMQRFSNDGFPRSKYAISQPDAEKWKRHESEINKASAIFRKAETDLSEFIQSE